MTPELLRAWERRYGLLRPSRSPGGFRLYSEADAERIGSMRTYLAQGVSAAEAARLVLAADEGTHESAREAPRADEAARKLREALDRLDEAAAQSALDELLATLTLDAVLRDVVLPYLHELGERWERGSISVGDEHFASNVIRGRLVSLARAWGQGTGPRVLLACAPGELHDLPLIMFGLALRARGWRVAFLGSDTPLPAVAAVAEEVRADLVVISATAAPRLEDRERELATIARDLRVALAGAGASEDLARRAGCEFLDADPITAAEELTRRRSEGGPRPS